MHISQVQYRLQIDSGDDAIVTDPAPEVARILRREAARIEDGGLVAAGETLRTTLHDTNGRKIGYVIAAISIEGDDNE